MAWRNAGLILRDGDLGEPDLKLAEFHFVVAGKLGDPEGFNSAGDLYYFNKYGQVDLVRALDCYKLAAAEGAPPENYRIGYIYKFGPDSVTNPRKAFEYTKIAADEGDPHALRRVGFCYADGYGVEPDRELAQRTWLQMEGSNVPVPWFYLGRLFEREDFEQAPDYALAREYYQRSIDAEDEEMLDSLVYLGYLYRAGLGGPVDYDKALALFQQAIDGGSAEGYDQMGYSYMMGLGVDQDFTVARANFEQALDMGFFQSVNHLGYLY